MNPLHPVSAPTPKKLCGGKKRGKKSKKASKSKRSKSKGKGRAKSKSRKH